MGISASSIDDQGRVEWGRWEVRWAVRWAVEWAVDWADWVDWAREETPTGRRMALLAEAGAASRAERIRRPRDPVSMAAAEAVGVRVSLFSLAGWPWCGMGWGRGTVYINNVRLVKYLIVLCCSKDPAVCIVLYAIR